MGMAASQARYLGIQARKTNVEYEGQQVNQQRTALANQSANLFRRLLTLEVPTPPDQTNYKTSNYTFSDATSSDGNATIEEITANDFNQIMREEGFYVTDISDEMEDTNISNVYTANNKELQIEFYVFKSNDIAKQAYESNKDMFVQNKDYEGKEKSDDDYNEYTQETEDYYNVLKRVGKTLLYASVNVDYKGDVKSAINKLGY